MHIIEKNLSDDYLIFIREALQFHIRDRRLERDEKYLAVIKMITDIVFYFIKKC